MVSDIEIMQHSHSEPNLNGHAGFWDEEANIYLDTYRLCNHPWHPS